jgi:hypothetical protein
VARLAGIGRVCFGLALAVRFGFLDMRAGFLAALDMRAGFLIVFEMRGVFLVGVVDCSPTALALVVRSLLLTGAIIYLTNNYSLI